MGLETLLNPLHILVRSNPRDTDAVGQFCAKLGAIAHELGKRPMFGVRDRRLVKECTLLVQRYCNSAGQDLEASRALELRDTSVRILNQCFEKAGGSAALQASDLHVLLTCNLRTARAHADHGKRIDALRAYRTCQSWWAKAIALVTRFEEEYAEAGLKLFKWHSQLLLVNGDAKSAWNQADHATHQILRHTRGDAHAYAMSLYNIGVKMYQSEDWAGAIAWLKLSHDALQFDPDSKRRDEKQARTIKAIASSHLHLGHYAKGLAVIELLPASKADIDVAYLEVRLLCMVKRMTQAESSFKAMLKRNDCTLDVCLAACNVVARSSLDTALRMYSALEVRYPKTPRVTVQKIRALVSAGAHDKARAAFEGTSTATDGKRGEDALVLDQFSSTEVQELVQFSWKCALSCIGDEDHDKAEWWLEKARLLSERAGDKPNQSRALLVLAQMLLLRGRADRALELATAAKLLDNSADASLHVVRASIATGVDAGQVRAYLSERNDWSEADLCLVAEESRRLDGLAVVTVEALNALCEVVEEGGQLHKDVVRRIIVDLVAKCVCDPHRCSAAPSDDRKAADVTTEASDSRPSQQSAAGASAPVAPCSPNERRLFALAEAHIASLAEHFATMIHENSKLKPRAFVDAATFVARRAWNIGKRAGDLGLWRSCSRIMSSAAMIFSSTNDYRPDDAKGSANAAKQVRMCLIMGASAAVEACWGNDGGLDETTAPDKPALARDALAAIERAESLMDASRPDEALMFCRVLKFGCLLFTRDPGAAELIESAARDSATKPVALETMGQMALQDPFDRPALALCALRAAFRLRFKFAVADWDRLAGLVTHVARLSPQTELPLFCDELCERLERPGLAPADKYPRAQAKWLVAWVWNTGVSLHRKRKLDQADACMVRAIRLVSLLLRDFPFAEEFRASHAYLRNEIALAELKQS